MYRQKALFLGSLFFVLISCLPDAFAQGINQTNYHYPYKDPFVATSTVAIMKGREEIPAGHIRDLEIQVITDRNNRYLLNGKGKLRFRFYQLEKPAPLVFIIPGMGSTAYAGSARYMAEFLAGHGFHVIIVPSPISWNFTLSASRSGTPGVTQNDAKDLYTVMQMTLSVVKQKWGAKIGKIGLLGLSEGALDAGFISKLDAAQRQIGIDTYLLVNPPVDLLEAVRKIDAMADFGKTYEKSQRNYLEAYAVGVVSDALHDTLDDPYYFLGWDDRVHLTDWQLVFLIGEELQKEVGDVIYTSDLAFHLGILKTPISWGYRTVRSKEASSYTLMAYIKVFLIPRIQHLIDKTMSLEKLASQNSLRTIKTTLANNKHIFLMHNRDDFLISGEDLNFLAHVFGNRAKFYPLGGHLGNLWYADNKRDILNTFKPLLYRSGLHAQS